MGVLPGVHRGLEDDYIGQVYNEGPLVLLEEFKNVPELFLFEESDNFVVLEVLHETEDVGLHCLQKFFL